MKKRSPLMRSWCVIPDVAESNLCCWLSSRQCCLTPRVTPPRERMSNGSLPADHARAGYLCVTDVSWTAEGSCLPGRWPSILLWVGVSHIVAAPRIDGGEYEYPHMLWPALTSRQAAHVSPVRQLRPALSPVMRLTGSDPCAGVAGQPAYPLDGLRDRQAAHLRRVSQTAEACGSEAALGQRQHLAGNWPGRGSVGRATSAGTLPAAGPADPGSQEQQILAHRFCMLY